MGFNWEVRWLASVLAFPPTRTGEDDEVAIGREGERGRERWGGRGERGRDVKRGRKRGEGRESEVSLLW